MRLSEFSRIVRESGRLVVEHGFYGRPSFTGPAAARLLPKDLLYDMFLVVGQKTP